MSRYKLNVGIQRGAQRVLIDGPEGIGKTTMASKFPWPVFVDIEDGSGHLDVARMPRPTTWDLAVDEVRSVAEDPSDFATVVIDSVDAAETLCHKEVCRANKKPSIESWGYGKGYTVAAEKFRELLEACDRCIDAGVNVVLVGHVQMRKFERPDESGAYDRFELKMHRLVASMVKEWADAVLFCDYKTFVSVDDNGKGHATGGKRVIRTAHNVSWDAKNRWGLPEELPLDDQGIAKVLENIHDHIGTGAGDGDKTEPTPKAAKPTMPPNASANKRKSGVPKKLRLMFGLCEQDGIKPAEVREVMIAKGKRSEEQALMDWEEPFIDWVTDQWPRVKELVEEARRLRKDAENVDIPF